MDTSFALIKDRKAMLAWQENESEMETENKACIPVRCTEETERFRDERSECEIRDFLVVVLDERKPSFLFTDYHPCSVECIIVRQCLHCGPQGKSEIGKKDATVHCTY